MRARADLRRRVVPALVVVAALVVGACSDDGDDTSTPSPPQQTVTAGTGDRCADETGDLDVPVGVDPADTSLAGVDLADARAQVEGEVLEISFTTAAPISAAPAPTTFVVAQGEPLQPLSFELRLTREGDGWAAVLIAWPSSREEREPVALDVVEDGPTLRTAVPLEDLPTIARSMQFGAAAEPEPGLIVIDDCNTLVDG